MYVGIFLVKLMSKVRLLRSIQSMPYLLLMFVCTFANANVSEQPSTRQSSVIDVARIYHASMAYIFSQQSLINSNRQSKPSLFGTPFIDQVKKSYQVMFGEAFPDDNDEYVDNLLTLMKLVMEDNRTLILDPDIGFKGFIPAIFAFQLSEKFKARGYGLNIKFTNVVGRIRNKLSSPDEWEQKALAAIANGNVSEVINNNIEYNGGVATRYMRKVDMVPMCLNCHGIPEDNPANKNKEKNNWIFEDKTGFSMEGWKMGELGGGISVVLYERKRSIYEEK